MRIRAEQPDDAAQIEALTVAAFADAPHSDRTEHFIVRALRRSGAPWISIVADDAGKVLGHLALSPVTVSGGAAHWYGLGPLSVLPSRQGQGIGSGLVRDGLARLRQAGAAGCVVLGDPGYYGRFGFRAASPLSLPGVPPAYFQSIAFDGNPPSGNVAYPVAFSARD